MLSLLPPMEKLLLVFRLGGYLAGEVIEQITTGKKLNVLDDDGLPRQEYLVKMCLIMEEHFKQRLELAIAEERYEDAAVLKKFIIDGTKTLPQDLRDQVDR